MEEKKSPVWLLRIIYSSRIFIILLALVFAVIIWQKNTQKLTDSIENLSVSNPNIPLLESGIMRLYQADNNFRYYTITYDKHYFKDFADDIRYISEILDTISKQSESDTTGIKLSGAINEKTSVAQVLVNLKKLTDSLLVNSVRWDTTQPRKILLPTYDINKLTELSQTTTTDTLNTANKKTKKGFFRKVRDLFKEDEEVDYVKTVVSKTSTVKDSTITEPIQQAPEYYVLNDIHQYYLDKFARIADGRNRLNDKEKQLAVINSDLIEQMQQMFAQLRDKEVEKVQQIKAEATQSGERSARRISAITLIAFLLASLTYFLILYYLRKINDRTKELEKQQLTINKLDEEKAGLLKLLGQFSENITKEEKNQAIFKEIVSEINFDPINTASDIRTDFNPYNTVSAVSGELLSFAKNKNLMIQSILPINQPVEVSGNSKSLEKIVSGLLYFAIYKTTVGEITVSAKVEVEESIKKLNVEVRDNAKKLARGDIAEYLTESVPGIAKSPDESLAELKLINSRRILIILGSNLEIIPEKDHNKYTFTINY